MSNYFVTPNKDCFGYYLSEIGRYPVLTKKQEYEYGIKVQTMLKYKALIADMDEATSIGQKAERCGCSVSEFNKAIKVGEISRERMLNHNLRLVVFIARKYNNRGVEIEDLVQEGNLGLVRAVEKFDPTLGFKFSTYASWWIKQSIIRAVANYSRTIRLPVHIHDLLNKIKKVERMLSQQKGRLVGASEIADALDLKLHKLQILQHCSKKVWSLDSETYNTEDSITINESFIDTAQIEEDKFIEDMQYKTALLLSLLENQERTVLILRYGLNHKPPMSYKAIAQELSLSIQCVRNINSRLMRKLKKLVEQEDINFYEYST
jgi:RNA polymerase nonessential primary-like sigma factor